MAVLVTTLPAGSSQRVEDGGTVSVPADGIVLFQIQLLDENGVPGPILDPGTF